MDSIYFPSAWLFGVKFCQLQSYFELYYHDFHLKSTKLKDIISIFLSGSDKKKDLSEKI